MGENESYRSKQWANGDSMSQTDEGKKRRTKAVPSPSNDCECKDCKLQGTGRPMHRFKEIK